MWLAKPYVNMKTDDWLQACLKYFINHFGTEQYERSRCANFKIDPLKSYSTDDRKFCTKTDAQNKSEVKKCYNIKCLSFWWFSELKIITMSIERASNSPNKCVQSTEIFVGTNDT
jgi:hypothetical protein